MFFLLTTLHWRCHVACFLPSVPFSSTKRLSFSTRTSSTGDLEALPKSGILLMRSSAPQSRTRVSRQGTCGWDTWSAHPTLSARCWLCKCETTIMLMFEQAAAAFLSLPQILCSRRWSYIPRCRCGQAVRHLVDYRNYRSDMASTHKINKFYVTSKQQEVFFDLWNDDLLRKI